MAIIGNAHTGKYGHAPVAYTKELLRLGNLMRLIYKLPSYIFLSMTYLRLTIQPIPADSRRASLANLMPHDQWDRLRRSVYSKARHRCQICGREGRMYAHEKWYFNEETGVQYLMGVEALCQDCHDVKHLFFIRNSPRRAILLRHFLAVNHVTRERGIQYLVDVYRRQQKLDRTNWIVNYGEFNWQIPATTGVQQRRDYARLNHPRYR